MSGISTSESLKWDLTNVSSLALSVPFMRPKDLANEHREHREKLFTKIRQLGLILEDLTLGFFDVPPLLEAKVTYPRTYIQCMLSIFPYLTTLRKLCLEDIEPAKEVGVFATGLSRLTTLEELRLINLQGSARNLEYFGTRCLCEMTGLRNLHLERIAVDTDKLKNLASILMQMTQLNGLSIHNIQLGSLRVTQAGEVVMPSMEIGWIATSLSYLTNLETLNLSQTNLFGAGVAALALGLQTMTALKELGLASNLIGGSSGLMGGSSSELMGIEALASSLVYLTALQKLSLERNSLDDVRGALALSGALHQLPSLRRLDIGGNYHPQSNSRDTCEKIFNECFSTLPKLCIFGFSHLMNCRSEQRDYYNKSLYQLCISFCVKSIENMTGVHSKQLSGEELVATHLFQDGYRIA